MFLQSLAGNFGNQHKEMQSKTAIGFILLLGIIATVENVTLNRIWHRDAPNNNVRVAQQQQPATPHLEPAPALPTTTQSSTQPNQQVILKSWPGDSKPDHTYQLQPGRTEIKIPPGADFAFNVPEHYRFNASLVSGDRDAIDVAMDGKFWNPATDNTDKFVDVHEMRYRNHSSYQTTTIAIAITPFQPQ